MISDCWSEKEKVMLLKATPSLQVAAWQSGRLVLRSNLGPDYAFYDLASLTKPIFSWTLVTQILKSRPDFLKARVVDFFPKFSHSGVLVEDLLLHRSGLRDWRPLYLKMRNLPNESQRREWLRDQILSNKSFFQPGVLLANCKAKQPVTLKSVYSDIGYLLLGLIFSEVEKKSLIDCWGDLDHSLGNRFAHSLHFCQGNLPKHELKLYAPTEKSLWRKKVLCGEVHDDNTWALGGVSTHAGLFGTIEDVGNWCLELRSSFVLAQESLFGTPETIRVLTKRGIARPKGDWCRGFMHPSLGKSSAGKYFSPRSIGHLGFTGTSFWIDPKRDLIVVILSNRVHPSRRNNRFAKLRPFLHDRIVQMISKA